MITICMLLRSNENGAYDLTRLPKIKSAQLLMIELNVDLHGKRFDGTNCY